MDPGHREQTGSSEGRMRSSAEGDVYDLGPASTTRRRSSVNEAMQRISSALVKRYSSNKPAGAEPATKAPRGGSKAAVYHSLDAAETGTTIRRNGRLLSKLRSIFSSSHSPTDSDGSGSGDTSTGARHPAHPLISFIAWTFDTLTCSRVPSAKLLRSYNDSYQSEHEATVQLESFKLYSTSDRSMLALQGFAHFVCALAYISGAVQAKTSYFGFTRASAEALHAYRSQAAVFAVLHIVLLAACAALALRSRSLSRKLAQREEMQRAFHSKPDVIRHVQPSPVKGVGDGASTRDQVVAGDGHINDSDAGHQQVDGAASPDPSSSSTSNHSSRQALRVLDPYTSSAVARRDVSKTFSFVTSGWQSAVLTSLMVVTNALLCGTLLRETLVGPYGQYFGQSGSRADALAAAILLGGTALISHTVATEYATSFGNAAAGISAIYLTSCLTVAALWGLPFPGKSGVAGPADFYYEAYLLRSGTSTSHCAMLYLLLLLAWYLSLMKAFERNVQIRLITRRYSRLEEGLVDSVRVYEKQLDALEAQLEQQAASLVDKYMTSFTRHIRDSIHGITALTEELIARNASRRRRITPHSLPVGSAGAGIDAPDVSFSPPIIAGASTVTATGMRSSEPGDGMATSGYHYAAEEKDDLADVLSMAMRVRRLLESWDSETLKKRLHRSLLPTIQHVKSLVESELPGGAHQLQQSVLAESESSAWRATSACKPGHARVASAPALQAGSKQPQLGERSETPASGAASAGVSFGPLGLRRADTRSFAPVPAEDFRGLGSGAGDGQQESKETSQGSVGGTSESAYYAGRRSGGWHPPHLQLPSDSGRHKHSVSEPVSTSSPPPDSMAVWTPSDKWGSYSGTPASAASPGAGWLLEHAVTDLLSDSDDRIDELPTGVSLSIDPLQQARLQGVQPFSSSGSGRPSHVGSEREKSVSGLRSGVAATLAGSSGSPDVSGDRMPMAAGSTPLAAAIAPTPAVAPSSAAVSASSSPSKPRLRDRFWPAGLSRAVAERIAGGGGGAHAPSPPAASSGGARRWGLLGRARPASPAVSAMPAIQEVEPHHASQPLASTGTSRSDSAGSLPRASMSPPLSGSAGGVSGGVSRAGAFNIGATGTVGTVTTVSPPPIHPRPLHIQAPPTSAAVQQRPQLQRDRPPALPISPAGGTSSEAVTGGPSHDSLSLSPASSGYEAGTETGMLGLQPGALYASGGSLDRLPTSAHDVTAATAGGAHADIMQAHRDRDWRQAQLQREYQATLAAPHFQQSAIAHPSAAASAATAGAAGYIVSSDGASGPSPRLEGTSPYYPQFGVSQRSSPAASPASQQLLAQVVPSPAAAAPPGGVGAVTSTAAVTVPSQPPFISAPVSNVPSPTLGPTATTPALTPGYAYSYSDEDMMSDEFNYGDVTGCSGGGGGGGNAPRGAQLEQFDYGHEHEYHSKQRRASAQGAQGPFARTGGSAVAAASLAPALGGTGVPNEHTIADTLVAAGISLQPTVVHGALTDASAVILGATGQAPPPGAIPPEGSGSSEFVTGGHGVAVTAGSAGSASVLASGSRVTTSMSESDAEDAERTKGTSVVVGSSLPSASAAAKAPILPSARTPGRPTLPSMQKAMAAAAGPIGKAGSAAGGDTEVDKEFKFGLHVLVVDDEKVNRKVTARMLEKLGCTWEAIEVRAFTVEDCQWRASVPV